MKCWLYNTLIFISLLLCAAMVAFWARSMWKWDSVAWNPRTEDYQRWELVSARGGMRIELVHYTGQMAIIGGYFGPDYGEFYHNGWQVWGDFEYAGDRATAYAAFAAETTPSFPWRTLGFELSEDFRTGGGSPTRMSDRWLVIPDWFLVALFAVLPWWRFHQLIQKHKRQSDLLCENCGYDLRATPERCPECGAIPTPRGPSQA